jgi:hypothetical protein
LQHPRLQVLSTLSIYGNWPGGTGLTHKDHGWFEKLLDILHFKPSV